MKEYKPFIDFSDLPKKKLASGEKIDKMLKGSKVKKSKRITKFSRYGR